MPHVTFRRHERITDPRDFRRAFDRRRSAADATLVVYGVENGRGFPRLGISVSRKKIRSAAARNRVKRLLREAFRLNKAVLPAGVDLVVVPRNQSLTFAEAQRSLTELARATARRLSQGTASREAPASSPTMKDGLRGSHHRPVPRSSSQPAPTTGGEGQSVSPSDELERRTDTTPGSP